MSSLRKKTISGFKWVAFGNYVQKGLSVITFIILARLLEPKVFGLFAMAFIVIDGLQLFRNFGVGAALIQRKDNIEDASHTAFWMMPFMGGGVFLILYVIAPFAAAALNEPSLTPVLRVLGVIFILGSMENVPKVLLSKELKFRELTIREFISAVLYSVSAILFALNQMGVWSLVYAYIIRRTSMLFLAWKLVNYTPRLRFNKKIAWELLHFGKFVLGSAATLFLIRNIDNFIIGRILGAAMLGYYALSFNIAGMTTTHLSSLMHRVLFPAFSKIQDDKDAIKRQSLKVMKILSIFSFPFGIMLILLGQEIVQTIYGVKWLPMVPALKILAITSIFLPLATLSGPIFISCGKPQWDFYARLGTISCMLVGIPLGISMAKLTGAAVAVTISNCIIIPIIWFLVNKLIKIKLTDIGLLLKPTIISSFIMGLIIAILKTWSYSHGKDVIPYWIFLIGVLVLSGGAYLLSFYFLDKKVFLEIKNILINK